MLTLPIMLAPLALLMHGAAGSAVVVPPGGDGGQSTAASADARPPVAYQVRMRSRVIIRVGPRQDRSAPISRPVQYRLEPLDGDCVTMSDIAAVQVGASNRLLLFMRDRRVVSATLERSCEAQAFYSGFYVEENADGRLCASRDMLHSRSGALCGVSQFNRVLASAP